MESEKVKEIKKVLEYGIENGIVLGFDTKVLGIKAVDILTLINELESENEELEQDLKKTIDMQKQMIDGFKTATKEVEENLASEIPNLLKQFAERLKEKVKNFCGTEYENAYYDVTKSFACNDIDETLKEFIGE